MVRRRTDGDGAYFGTMEETSYSSHYFVQNILFISPVNINGLVQYYSLMNFIKTILINIMITINNNSRNNNSS